jgi:acyl-CoA thioesterase I
MSYMFNEMKFRNIPSKSIVLFFCFAVVVGGLFTTTVSADETKIIIGFGDSVTEGCGNMVSTCGVTCRPGDNCYDYEDNLESLLIQNKYEYMLTNFGWGGETTSEGISRLTSVIDNDCNQGAEYILIMEGTNDLLHGTMGVNVKFNLGVMIDMSREQGLKPLLATLPPDLEPGHEYKNIPLMNNYIRELAVEKNVVLVDLYNALEPDWNVYTDPRACYGDLTHPNRSGFDAMGAVWYESLTEVLPSPLGPLTWLMLLLNKP